MRLRVLGLAGLALVCISFPDIGPNRFVLAILLVALTPVPALLPRITPPEHWMTCQSAFDIAATVALIGLVPDVWTAGLVVVISSATAGAALLGRRAFIVLESAGIAGLGTVAAMTGVQDWVVPVVVAAIMMVAVASYIDVFFSKELSTAARLNDLASSSSAIFWESDADTGELLALSEGAHRVLGISDAHTPATIYGLISHLDHELWDRAAADRSTDQLVLECRTPKQGAGFTWMRLTATRLTVRGREVLRGTAIDVTELITAHEAVRIRAETDDLTGLSNRSSFLSYISERLTSGGAFGLLVMDLDRFKDVNDTLGHHAGDIYLVEIARRLASTIDSNGMVARVGGDEFAIAVEARRGLDQVMELARSLRTICEEQFFLDGIEYTGAVSVGVAVSPLHGVSQEDLMRRADLAMYAAKRTGSGVHLFEFQADERKVSRLRLSSEAGPALAAGQMRLWFQPKIDLATGSLTGAEGLLRWEHPVKGVLTPAEFLDFVELSRHRSELCATVIEQGAMFLALGRAYGVEIRTSVNVSIGDLLDEDFSPMVNTIFEEHGISQGQIVLEVTEREIMDDRTGFERAAAAVQRAGVELSIDDFGTGHSSLLRLHQLPVDELKIDRSFVSGLRHNSSGAVIVKSIIDLGRSLGHRVIAEGIESPDEVAVLQDLGCTEGQGYLYSAALPAEDFFEAIKTNDPTLDRAQWPARADLKANVAGAFATHAGSSFKKTK